jgi:hypothetical protein
VHKVRRQCDGQVLHGLRDARASARCWPCRVFNAKPCCLLCSVRSPRPLTPALMLQARSSAPAAGRGWQRGRSSARSGEQSARALPASHWPPLLPREAFLSCSLNLVTPAACCAMGAPRARVRTCVCVCVCVCVCPARANARDRHQRREAQGERRRRKMFLRCGVGSRCRKELRVESAHRIRADQSALMHACINNLINTSEAIPTVRVCVCVCVRACIYIQRERDSENKDTAVGGGYMYVICETKYTQRHRTDTHTHTHTHTHRCQVLYRMRQAGG